MSGAVTKPNLISFPSTTESLPRLEHPSPGAPQEQQPGQPASSSAAASSSTPAALPATPATQKAAAALAEYENIIKGWQAVRSFENISSAFSWWPGQVPGERGVYHTQTKLPGDCEGLLIDIGAFDNLM
eukprot:6854063-Prorocentrum_lima.AAC.1